MVETVQLPELVMLMSELTDKLENKRILIVSQHYWPESFRINDISEGFIERGYDVEVLCGIPNYPTGQFFDGYGLTKNRRQEKNGIKIRRCFE